jgi:copper chaperone CopZ
MRLACSTDQREEKRKSQRSEPTTGKPKSGQVLVRTQGGKKGRTVVAPDEAPLQPCGLFADLVKLQSCEPSTENTKSGQVLVRTRGGEKAGQWRLRKRCCRHHEGLFVDLVKLRSCNLQRKTQKADRFWFAPGKGKTEIHQLFKGYVRSSEIRFEKKQVLVTFDDAKTNTDALVEATTNAGYPSQPEKAGK